MTKIGARHVAGRFSFASIRASPACDSGNAPVVAVGPACASAPQSREADTVVTGPAVPSAGRIRPSILMSSSPLALSRTLDLLSTHGAPAAAIPWNGGSVGTLGARPERTSA